MENILSEFKVDNLDIKLTSEKLFINTSISNEVFALRSINGIGVIDLVDDYNKELTVWKNKSKLPYFLFALGGILFISGIAGKSEGASSMITIGLAALVVGYFIFNKSKNDKPTLISAVRIMISGGNRDFQFDKTGVGSNNIAEFVAKVESTLTSYQKNNL